MALKLEELLFHLPEKDRESPISGFPRETKTNSVSTFWRRNDCLGLVMI